MLKNELKNKLLITIDQDHYNNLQNNVESIQEDVITIYNKISKLENKINQILELLKNFNETNKITSLEENTDESEDQYQYIEIKDKTYILNDSKVYKIKNNNEIGKLYGYYNFKTNKVKKVHAEIKV